jgi:glycosyltransferase involved in cell wall biosynthesis
MYDKKKPSFAFLVLTYNHEDWIIEHLESIKYLVQNHSAGSDVDLIISDDSSKDQTKILVDRWLTLNANLFRHFKTIYNSKNLGTCTSLNNMLNHMVADRCKVTAGDDVYSFENIFELSYCEGSVAMLSGRVLYLREDNVSLDKISNILTIATQIIYQKNSLLQRFKHWSYTNAPNLLYASECLMHPAVREYLQRFDVIEDWPLQIAISRHFPDRKIKLLDRVLVYYRRTLGSTYIVANERFKIDKEILYKDLIKEENSWLERLRLRSRLFCFRINNKYTKNILNIDAYFFTAAFVKRFFLIKSEIKAIDLKLHRAHYQKIKKQAADFLGNSNK